jgi:hypothetical protein
MILCSFYFNHSCSPDFSAKKYPSSTGWAYPPLMHNQCCGTQAKFVIRRESENPYEANPVIRFPPADHSAIQRQTSFFVAACEKIFHLQSAKSIKMDQQYRKVESNPIVDFIK